MELFKNHISKTKWLNIEPMKFLNIQSKHEHNTPFVCCILVFDFYGFYKTKRAISKREFNFKS